MWTPQSEQLFYPEEKTIPIAFVGSVGEHYVDRSKYLKYLTSNGVDVLITGGQRENKLSAENYAATIRRTRISINFSRSPEPSAHLHQAKGRVFESLACKCLLLESVNPVTAMHFREMVDYVPFFSENDLLEKIRFYQTHPEVTDSISENGYNRYKELYSNKKFWEKVLS